MYRSGMGESSSSANDDCSCRCSNKADDGLNVLDRGDGVDATVDGVNTGEDDEDAYAFFERGVMMDGDVARAVAFAPPLRWFVKEAPSCCFDKDRHLDCCCDLWVGEGMILNPFRTLPQLRCCWFSSSWSNAKKKRSLSCSWCFSPIGAYKWCELYQRIVL